MSFTLIRPLLNAAAAPASTASTPTPSPASTAPAAAAPTTPPAPAAAPWYGNLPDDAKGFIESKQFPDLATMVKSHASLESMLGAPKERLLKLPEKADDPSWAEIYNRLGKPAKAEDYKIPVPQGQSDEFAKWAKDVFHGANLTTAQAETIASKWNEFVAQSTTKNTQAAAEQSHAQVANLKKEWGAAFEQNVKIANTVAEAMGIDLPTYQKGEQTFGVDGWAKMLNSVVEKFGVNLSEAPFHHGGTGGTGFQPQMTPAAAQEKLNTLQRDQDWIKKFRSGSSDHVAEFKRLNQAIFAGRTDIPE